MAQKELSKRIKELRKSKGLSQEDLAEDSGLSLRTIQRIENGKSDPRGDTLKRLANALNVSPDELIDWTIKESKGYNIWLNLSALFFLLYSILGIIVPFILWIIKKEKIRNCRKIGINLLNFQITWILVYYLGLAIITIMSLKGIGHNESSIINQVINIIKGDVVVKDAATTGGNVLGSLISTVVNNALFIGIMYTTNVLFILINTIRIYLGNDVKYLPRINFIGK